jgi:hypothetical protein
VLQFKPTSEKYLVPILSGNIELEQLFRAYNFSLIVCSYVRVGANLSEVQYMPTCGRYLAHQTLAALSQNIWRGV